MASQPVPDASRAYRLGDDEDASEGIRRIARGQIDGAVEELRDAEGAHLAEAIHGARKRFKRTRALVRLIRDDLGDDVYRRENETFREAGRRLSGARDAKVLMDTLDALCRRYADEIPDGAFSRLRAELVAEQDVALRQHVPAVGEVIGELATTRPRITAWPLTEPAGHGLLAPGFRRIYRRGRKTLRAARKDPASDSLHELRKRAKDLWHAAQIARPAAPKKMRKLARRAHKLSDVVGDHHDLAVLREAAAARDHTLGEEEHTLLRALVERRQARLERKALRRARRLYSAKPRKLIRPLRSAST